MESSSVSKDGPFEINPISSRPSGSGLASYFAPVTNTYDTFARWRANLGLPNPGNVEGLQKEIKMTHLTNFMFDGARADLTKSLSMSPMFQVSHAFALASQTSLPSYNFGTVFANQTVFLQGNVDHEGLVNGRFNAGWSPNHVSKVQLQFAPSKGMGSMIQMEHDYQGSDCAVNVKAINPSPVDLSGVYIGSYMQSLTKNIALGAESVYQAGSSQIPGVPPVSTSYVGKYTSTNKDWIASAQIQPAGMFTAGYWQKISDKVEAAAELQMVSTQGKRDAVATLGAKYDFRSSTFRAQVDSTGKVSALLEQRFAPTFAFIVAGEIEHFKNSAKVGIGVMIESTSLTPEEMGMPPQPPYSSYP